MFALSSISSYLRLRALLPAEAASSNFGKSNLPQATRPANFPINRDLTLPKVCKLTLHTSYTLGSSTSFSRSHQPHFRRQAPWNAQCSSAASRKGRPFALQNSSQSRPIMSAMQLRPGTSLLGEGPRVRVLRERGRSSDQQRFVVQRYTGERVETGRKLMWAHWEGLVICPDAQISSPPAETATPRGSQPAGRIARMPPLSRAPESVPLAPLCVLHHLSPRRPPSSHRAADRALASHSCRALWRRRIPPYAILSIAVSLAPREANVTVRPIAPKKTALYLNVQRLFPCNFFSWYPPALGEASVTSLSRSSL